MSSDVSGLGFGAKETSGWRDRTDLSVNKNRHEYTALDAKKCLAICTSVRCPQLLCGFYLRRIAEHCRPLFSTVRSQWGFDRRDHGIRGASGLRTPADFRTNGRRYG